MDLSQLGINTQDITNGSGSIPGLGNIQSLMGTITLISIIVGGLFFVLYLINVIQRIRADRAMIAMHKDITAIRAMMEQKNAPTPTAVAIIPPAPEAAAPTMPIRDESESASTTPEHTS